MYLTEVSRNDIKDKRLYKPSPLLSLLEQFVASGYDCAKIEGGREHYASANAGQTTIQHAIKRYKFSGIACISRAGEFYLVKLDSEKRA